MSDTPTIQEQCYGTCWAASNRIEDLERELAEAKAERDRAREVARQAQRRDHLVDKLQAHNERMRKAFRADYEKARAYYAHGRNQMYDLYCGVAKTIHEAGIDNSTDEQRCTEGRPDVMLKRLIATWKSAESQLTDHKAALTKAHNILEEIVSAPFYQRTCRGGEMERLMNQAIESLSAVNTNQASQ